MNKKGSENRPVIICDCHLYQGRYKCRKCGHYHYTSSYGGWGETCFHKPHRTIVEPITSEYSKFHNERVKMLLKACNFDDDLLIDRFIASEVWKKFDIMFAKTPHSALKMIQYGVMIGRLYGREK